MGEYMMHVLGNYVCQVEPYRFKMGITYLLPYAPYLSMYAWCLAD